MKTERPTFTMVVEPGALVPGDAYSQERLDTYRRGSTVEVTITQEKNPKLLKKYFAILALAVRQCRTPWKSTDEADLAIRRFFGIVRHDHLANGTEVINPGSLAKLDGPDFETYFEAAMGLLHKITGVDPETLRKESAEPLDEDQPDGTSAATALATVADDDDREGRPSSSLATPVVDGGGATPPITGAAADHAVPAEDQQFMDDYRAGNMPRSDPPLMRHSNIVGSIEADERVAVASAEPMNTRELKQEAIKKVLDLALDDAMTEQERREELTVSRDVWVARMPGHPDFIKTVFETAAKVMRGELPRPAATKYLFGLKDG